MMKKYGWAWVYVLVGAIGATGDVRGAYPPLTLPSPSGGEGWVRGPRVGAWQLLQEMGNPPEGARRVLEKPTLVLQGPGEKFPCHPEHYYWFLDHPDRAVQAWRRLGAQCVSITPRGDDTFSWRDGQGSEVIWETIGRPAGQRVWYAEGKVRPGPALPLVPVRAVVVLRFEESRTAEGNALIRHQATLYVHTDNKTAGLVTRLLGNSMQRMGEQGLAQMQFFFAGLSWYLDRHPEKVGLLMNEGN